MSDCYLFVTVYGNGQPSELTLNYADAEEHRRRDGVTAMLGSATPRRAILPAAALVGRLLTIRDGSGRKQPWRRATQVVEGAEVKISLVVGAPGRPIQCDVCRCYVDTAIEFGTGHVAAATICVTTCEACLDVALHRLRSDLPARILAVAVAARGQRREG